MPPRKKTAAPSLPSTTNLSHRTAALEASNAQHISQYGQTPRTKGAYGGYIDRALDWLEKLIEERQTLHVKDGIPTKELARAFESVPNRWSNYALQLHLGELCITGDPKTGKILGKSSADGLCGAFVKYWSRSYVDQPISGQLNELTLTMCGRSGYSSDYRLDDSTGKVVGCPANAVAIRKRITAVLPTVSVHIEVACARLAMPVPGVLSRYGRCIRSIIMICLVKTLKSVQWVLHALTELNWL